MTPDPNPPDSFFNFNAIPLWLYPDLWNEKKKIRFRGFWFIFLYLLSTLIFTGGLLFLGGVLFSKPMATTAFVWLAFGIPIGLIFGVASWWDFMRRSRNETQLPPTKE